ncbi:DUF3263 domain-containing protein [Micromonospora radicis]|uniref:DUF3263 domain-containing protein n=1 Tax=Micromonospora radicis TaxID=1894971 RepID=A0A418MT57_9ACTN|nr:DUF3263 domain-containing protein [Micromonospora radicis]RIV37263.1 DUF3263 domain-containing protein [Micromonospora radicis]
MQPADATPTAHTGSDAGTVPPPRSAPEVESAPTRRYRPAGGAPDDRVPGTPAQRGAPAPGDAPGPAVPASADDENGGEAEPGEAASGATPTDPAAALGERDREILAFERQWWRHAGAKEQAIRDRFGLSATRYYQLLNALLDNPAALAVDPVLVGRLRRLRASRTRNRRR